jgi:hypothetical protein
LEIILLVIKKKDESNRRFFGAFICLDVAEYPGFYIIERENELYYTNDVL